MGMNESEGLGVMEDEPITAITFEATIHGQRTDGDGETKLTLAITRQDLDAVRSLLGLDSKRLGVAISVIADKEDAA